jgi:hypothetical protein
MRLGGGGGGGGGGWGIDVRYSTIGYYGGRRNLVCISGLGTRRVLEFY